MFFFLISFFFATKVQITISGAFALYPLMVEWAEEYKRINPNVEISVQAGGTGKGMVDLLNNMIDIAMVSREVSKEEEEKGAYKIAVCKDSTLPIISSKNPFKDILLKRGIKKTELLKIFTSKMKFWDDLLGKKYKENINVYTRSDACGAAENFANLFGLHQEDLEGIGIYGDPQMVETVGRDDLGIGYANIGFIYDNNTKKPFENILVLPFDLNENGKIEEEEDFYKEREKILLAIHKNILPSPPARNLYLVISKDKTKPVVIDFIKWILKEGQKIVGKAGFVQIEIKREDLNF